MVSIEGRDGGWGLVLRAGLVMGNYREGEQSSVRAACVLECVGHETQVS